MMGRDMIPRSRERGLVAVRSKQDVYERERSPL